MTSLINSVKAVCRAAVVALALAASAIVAVPAPAMAQSFSFQFGDGNFSFGIGRDGVRIRPVCLTDRQIRRGLQEEGWRNITFRQERRNSVRVIAEWRRNGRLYSMWINRCTGDVTDIERVRRRGTRGPGIELDFELNF